MTSIKTVAQQAQVSIATVSRVLNGTKYVSPDVEKRVLEAISALNYQPNAPARNLRRQQTLSVGVLLPRLNDFFFSDLAYVLEKTLSAAGYNALFCSTENEEEKEAAIVNNLIMHRVDAVILVPSVPVQKSLATVNRLLERSIPVVLVDRGMPGFAVSQVLSNNEQGAYDATAYLLDLGHRYIGVIDSGTGTAKLAAEPGHERMKGIQRAMRERGIALDNSLVIFDQFENIEMGYHGTLRLLTEHPHISAIFALTDAIAVGVLRAASELGWRVPHDLSVSGFDDLILASHVIPRLTTVAQPVQALGEKATELLLRQIHDPETSPETVMLDTRLVIRESTAPPRSP
ncbi:MAG TPA: LacI family DNA-binding transcriptional regulator [Phototrophicaceae bacterium]|nr:LacI family DNA-binding transcriptional regulator [Phototrophicaceae bacterium]